MTSKMKFRAGWLLCGFAALTLAGCQDPKAPAPAPPAGQRPTAASFGQPALVLAENELAIRLSGTGKGIQPDQPAVFATIERMAEAGQPSAQQTIGEAYLAGAQVRKDPQIAASWLAKAADQKQPRAQTELAFLYLNGIGVPKDYARALELAQAAAAQGSVEAESAIGQIYLGGPGVEADPARALEAYRKAAAAKSSVAMAALGTLYRDGKGVSADKVTALAWFDLSIAYSKETAYRDLAARQRDDLALVLLPAETALAQRLAGDWKPGEDLAAKRAAIEVAKADQAPTAAGNLVLAGSPAAAMGGKRAKPEDIGVVEKLVTFDIDVQPDGSSTRLYHVEFQPKKEAVLKELGQLPLPYSASLDTVELVEAYTLKPDGRKLPVDPAAVYAQLVPGTPTLPMFDDQHQKVVVFPYVEVGDTLVLTARYVEKPRIPGLFSLSWWFYPTDAIGDARITIKAPKSMPLATETHDIKFDRQDAGDRISYEWRYANPEPAAPSYAVVDLRDRVPRLSVSSFQSYEQLARAYAALAEPKMTPTPKIKALAAEITAGKSDRRARAEAIYGWVSRHIRYVGIELGAGGMVPHDADTVLANGYGDCKDHSVLFSALLKAAGIASDIVLINGGTSFELPKAPTIGTLNHAITYLPELDLYADTTAGVAPFGVLPLTEYGKPVIHTLAAAKSVQRTPALKSDAASISIKTTAHLGSDGKVTGESETIATGPFSIWTRQMAIAIEAGGPEQIAKKQLQQVGLDGSGSYELGAPYELAPSYRLKGHFESGARAEYLAGTSFFVPTALSAGVAPGDLLIGPLSLVDPAGTEPTACYSGRETEEASLELPTGKHLRELPKGRAHRSAFPFQIGMELRGPDGDGAARIHGHGRRAGLYRRDAPDRRQGDCRHPG